MGEKNQIFVGKVRENDKSKAILKDFSFCSKS